MAGIPNVGTLVGAAIRPINSADSISTAYANEIKGGVHGYETISERNSLILPRRQWGMLVVIYNDAIPNNNKTYQLTYGHDIIDGDDIMNNNNWVEYSGASSTESITEWLNSVISIELNQPSTPTNGDRYLVGLDSSATVTGALWSTFVPGFIAQYDSSISSWDITYPKNGTTIRVDNIVNKLYKYEGTYSTGEWLVDKLTQVFSVEFTGDGTNYTTTAIPTITTYESGTIFLSKFDTINSGLTMSVNINGIGVKTVKKPSNNGLIGLLAGDIHTDNIYSLTYDSSNDCFQFIKNYSNDSYNIKYYIEPSDYIVIPPYHQYWVYGDLTVDGTIVNYGELIIADGQLIVTSGTVSNFGTIELLSLNNTSTSLSLITITKVALYALILANGLIPGSTYKINGVHPTLYDDGTTSGTSILLQAVTTSKLSTEGSGIFYNPKYDQLVDGFGVWTNHSSWSLDYSSLVDVFDPNEDVIADSGATGYLVGTIDSGYFIRTGGDWTTATYINGVITGAYIEINSVTLKSYSVGEKVIWGGYSWTNVNGNIGSATDILSLNSEWVKDTYDEINYNLVVDSISYDYENDMITRRHEESSNNLVIYTFEDYNFFANNVSLYDNAISVFMWGNKYNGLVGIENNIVENSYFECVDFKGNYIFNNTLSKHSLIYYNTMSVNSNLSFNELIDSAFAANTIILYSVISYNRLNSGNILGNTVTDSSILGNVIVDSGLNTNVLSSLSSITHNNILNVSYIRLNKITNGFIDTNYLYDSCDIKFNILTRSSTSTSIDANELKSNSEIVLNILTDSYIQQNNINTNSTIDNNDLSQSIMAFNILNNYSYIQQNTLLISSNIVGNNISNNGIIRNNNISYSSFITYNSILDDSEIKDNIIIDTLIRYNKLSLNSAITDNTASDSPNSYFCEISYNILDVNSEINSNDLSSTDVIKENELNNSTINGNTLLSASSSSSGIVGNLLYSLSKINVNELTTTNIEFNKLNSGIIQNTILNNSALISKNTLNNSTFDLGTNNPLGLDDSLSNIDIRDINLIEDISSATIIYGDYSKYIFKVSGGNSKLGYYDSVGSFTIQDVDA